MEENYHFLASSDLRNRREPIGSQGFAEALCTLLAGSANLWGGSGREAVPVARSVQASCQALSRQVPMYCFRFGNCGTFMPLSGVRGEFKIAVVWTWFVAGFSAISSGHFRVLFTRSVVISAVNCR